MFESRASDHKVRIATPSASCEVGSEGRWLPPLQSSRRQTVRRWRPTSSKCSTRSRTPNGATASRRSSRAGWESGQHQDDHLLNGNRTPLVGAASRTTTKKDPRSVLVQPNRRTIRAGLPPARTSASISEVTKDPAITCVLSPMVRPGMTALFTPKKQLVPTFTPPPKVTPAVTCESMPRWQSWSTLDTLLMMV